MKKRDIKNDICKKSSGKQRKNRFHAIYNFPFNRCREGAMSFGRVVGFGIYVIFSIYFAIALVFETTKIITASAMLSLAREPLYMCVPWFMVCLFLVLMAAWAFVRALSWGRRFFLGKKRKTPDNTMPHDKVIQ